MEHGNARAPGTKLGTIGKKTAPILVINRPDKHTIARGQRERIHRIPPEQPENALVNIHGLRGNRLVAVKKKHEPMAGTLVTTLRNHAKKMQIGGGKPQPRLLARFTNGTLKGRLPKGHFKLPPHRTPAIPVGRLVATKHQVASMRVLDKDKNADFKWQGPGGGVNGSCHAK